MRSPAREHRGAEGRHVGKHPHDQEREGQPPVVDPPTQASPGALLVEPREQVFVRRDPPRLVARHLGEQVRVVLHDPFELLEGEAAVVVRVGFAQERVGQVLDLRIADPHVVLRQADGDHAHQLGALERAVAVVVVEPKRERELVACRAEDDLPHAGQELVAADHTVAVLIEEREHAPREVVAAQAERRPERGLVDGRGLTRVSCERALEHLEQARVHEGNAFCHRTRARIARPSMHRQRRLDRAVEVG